MLWWADIEATIWELRATGLRNYLQLEVPYRELRAKTITGYIFLSGGGGTLHVVRAARGRSRQENSRADSRAAHEARS